MDIECFVILFVTCKKKDEIRDNELYIIAIIRNMQEMILPVELITVVINSPRKSYQLMIKLID